VVNEEVEQIAYANRMIVNKANFRLCTLLMDRSEVIYRMKWLLSIDRMDERFVFQGFYDEVVDGCGLARDFETLIAGDLSVVGKRGLNVIKDGGIHQAGKYRDLVEDPTNHFSQDESNVASPKSDISVDDESSSTTGILEMIMVRDVKARAECPPLPAVGSQVWLFSGRCDQNLQIKDIAKHETGTTEFCTNKKLETKESREASVK
ncbi:hypothetical protein Tco_1414420, partial [Tanacetum coccineum]